jgi:hypothetical protein
LPDLPAEPQEEENADASVFKIGGVKSQAELLALHSDLAGNGVEGSDTEEEQECEDDDCENDGHDEFDDDDDELEEELDGDDDDWEDEEDWEDEDDYDPDAENFDPNQSGQIQQEDLASLPLSTRTFSSASLGLNLIGGGDISGSNICSPFNLASGAACTPAPEPTADTDLNAAAPSVQQGQQANLTSPRR